MEVEPFGFEVDEEPEAWQPIETAPKDGNLILTWGECRAQYAVSYWDDDWNEWLTDFQEKGHPQIVYCTHWMPLPTAPTIKES
jgi:hypothetical protein